MIKETLIMFTAALNDGSYGVSNFVTGSLTAYSELDNVQVALGGNAEPYPSLSVRLADPLEVQGEVFTNIRDGIDLNVQVTYVGRDIDTPAGVTTMYEVFHGIQKSVREWMRNINESARISDSIQVVSCNRMVMTPNQAVSSDAIIPGGVTLSFYVRDIAGV